MRNKRSSYFRDIMAAMPLSEYQVALLKARICICGRPDKNIGKLNNIGVPKSYCWDCFVREYDIK